MNKILKNVLSIPVIYIMFAFLFFIADIIFGIIYHYTSYLILAIIPTVIIWFVLQCLIVQYVLRKLVSNGIFYLISHFLIIGYLLLMKYASYLWYLQNHKESQIAIELQRSIFIAEILFGIIACFIVGYTWKRFYK